MRNRKLIAFVLIMITAVAFAFAGGSKEEAASSSGRPVLRVAMECGYAPYNWTQPTDANGAVPIADSPDYAYGYDVMMAKLIAEEIGYDLDAGEKSAVIDQNGYLFLVQCLSKTEHDYKPFEDVKANIEKILREEHYDQVVEEKAESLQIDCNYEDIYSFTLENIN